MHILIVEDDPVVADVLGMTLEEAGHFQSTAHNIETALAELKHNTIDAVLLDINLPDGDGTRLARLIRKNHMPVPILVVSGNASTDDKIAALGAGADGYLTIARPQCLLATLRLTSTVIWHWLTVSSLRLLARNSGLSSFWLSARVPC